MIGCTHYVDGAGELQYLNRDDAPDVQFVTRDTHFRFRPRLCSRCLTRRYVFSRSARILTTSSSAAGASSLAEAARGSQVAICVCSRGESGTNGTPDEREAEAKAAADLLGATLSFLEVGGDCRM